MNIVPASYWRYPIYVSPGKKVEMIARTCYKSEDLITEDSWKKMIASLIKRKHLAMIEHATIALRTDENFYSDTLDQVSNLRENYQCLSFLAFSKNVQTTCNEDLCYVISGNLRTWHEFIENLVQYNERRVNKQLLNVLLSTEYLEFFKDLPWVNYYEEGHCEEIPPGAWITFPEDIRKKHETLSVEFTVDRGVTHEMVRHRPCSFAQESTRYCNYAKGKFGEQLTVIKPCFWEEGTPEYSLWLQAMSMAENCYLHAMFNGSKPQEARSMLPNSLKSQITITATLGEWHHIFNLRACDATGAAHPQIKEVMVPLLKELQLDDHYWKIFADLEA